MFVINLYWFIVMLWGAWWQFSLITIIHRCWLVVDCKWSINAGVLKGWNVLLEWNIALNIYCQALLSNIHSLIDDKSLLLLLWMPYFSVTIFCYVFLIGNKLTNLNMQQDNLAAACCMNDDVMFAELALNVG